MPNRARHRHLVLALCFSSSVPACSQALNVPELPNVCGDGNVAAGEQCDDGNRLLEDGCSIYCRLEVGWSCYGEPSTCVTACGDGCRAGQEACDDGVANKDGWAVAKHCNADCSGYGPYCGDGRLDPEESCDHLSRNSDAWSPTRQCNASCSGWAPFCGDGSVDAEHEVCDAGVANSDAWTLAGSPCDKACSGPGPHCGDRVVDAGHEVCDDGAWNVDSWARWRRCNTTCSGYASYCGDRIVDTPHEVCDQGGANSDLWALTTHCNATCSGYTGYCGDGLVDVGHEDCDDAAANDGREGGCSSECDAVPTCTSVWQWTTTPAFVTVPAALPAPNGSACVLPMPPPSRVPCDVPVPASESEFYVSATTGNDANSGRTITEPWKTLWHAVDIAPAGSAIYVAEGTYTATHVSIEKEMTVKGGYDTTFSAWDPDAHPSYFLGRVKLNHNGAVFGGFRLLSVAGTGPPLRGYVYYHELNAGVLMGNYIQTIITSTDGAASTYAHFPVAIDDCGGARVALLCNDIYTSGRHDGGPLTTGAAVYHQVSEGEARIVGNRICVDYQLAATTVGVLGGGLHFTALGNRDVLANNIIENPRPLHPAVFFATAEGLELVMTSNTIIGAIGGDGGDGSVIHWKLTNNIVAGRFGSGAGVILAVDDPVGVVLESAENNLVFGFADNSISPAPLFSLDNDTSGVHLSSEVFGDLAAGDLTCVAGGPADDTGKNVHGDTAYGGVTDDLLGVPRPESAAWDRGALACQ